LDQWRSSKPLKVSEPDAPPFRRKVSGFITPESQAGAADKEDVWTIGSRFKPSPNGVAEETSGRSITHRAKTDMGPPRESPSDEGDWRSSARPQKPNTRSSVSRKIT
jgi:translation initiation factor 4B